MDITNYSDFRQNLKSFLDKVFESRKPIFVTRPNGQNVVVLSQEEYDGMQETLHLMSSPKNASRLKESIAEFESNGGLQKDLIEE